MKIIKNVDLDDFAFVKENRDLVGGRKYRDLLESIERIGYLISPIVVMPNDNLGNLVDLDDEEVRSNGAKYIVIDGQHRLSICRDLEIPPVVVLNELASREDIVLANTTGNKWNLLDYVNFYKEKNVFDFIQLDAMIRAYSQKGFTTSAVIEAFHITHGGNAQVKEGGYKIDPVNGHHVLMSCLSVKSVMPSEFKQVKLIRALKSIFERLPSFDMSVVANEISNGAVLELKAVPSKDSNAILDIYANKFKSVESHSIPHEMREFVYAYYNGKCNFDGCGEKANNVDHIHPYSKGGSTSIDNLQLLCEKCNKEKSNKLI